MFVDLLKPKKKTSAPRTHRPLTEHWTPPSQDCHSLPWTLKHTQRQLHYITCIYLIHSYNILSVLAEPAVDARNDKPRHMHAHLPSVLSQRNGPGFNSGVCHTAPYNNHNQKLGVNITTAAITTKNATTMQERNNERKLTIHAPGNSYPSSFGVANCAGMRKVVGVSIKPNSRCDIRCCTKDNSHFI